MKISALRLFNVKRFAGRGVAIEGIGDGVNVLSAANEAGKSTSFEALHALFFQPHTGTPGDVQKLRPYSGGSPRIEADIETPEGKFRLSKQFYSGKHAKVSDLNTGRLIAQADEAENFIAGLIKGGAASPAGLLWVRQGITGLEKRSKTEEDGEKQVRASLLESVQGEVEAVTGGRRMAEIIGACSEALSKYVTAGGKPKAGGQYLAAIEHRDHLAAEEKRLAAEVQTLRDALDKRADATKRLEELERPEEQQRRRQDVERAEKDHQAAKAQGEKLKTAEAECNLVRERRDAAVRDLTTFRDALSRLAKLREQIVEVERRRKDAIDRRAHCFDAIEQATAKADSAEQEEQELRALLSRIDAAMRAREAAERRDELKQRLANAEAARQNYETIEAELTLLQLPDGAVDELQEMDIEIARLRAIETTTKATVAIDYEVGVQITATLDDQPLQHGEERGYEGQSRLNIPGIGTVTLRSNQQQGANDRLESIIQKRHTLLASMGVADIAAARRRQVEAQKKSAALGELRSRIRALAPDGLQKLHEDVARLDTASSDDLELKADPAEVRDSLASAEKKRLEARNALREAQPSRAAAEDAYVAAETALTSLTTQIGQLDAILGNETLRAQREQTLNESVATLNAEFQRLDGDAATLRATMADVESIAATLRRTKSVEDAAIKQSHMLRETIAGLTGQIRKDSDGAIEEEWQETAERLSAAEQRVQSFENEVAVLTRLRTALEQSRSKARELYLKPVMGELRPLLGLLFQDVAITFDEKTLLPQTISRNGQEEDVERLSGGMREQLSVLTRLAFARLLARDGRPAPVILDDALVYSDDDRIGRMFDALHRQARDQQIIVFSCRQRAFSMLGGNVLQMTDWQPSD